MNEFQRWLLQKMNERNLSARETSEGAGLNHGAVSLFLAGRRPSAISARKLARFFSVPDELVLVMTGYMAKPAGYDDFVAEITKLTEGWTDDQKALLLRLVRQLAEHNESMPTNERVGQS